MTAPTAIRIPHYDDEHIYFPTDLPSLYAFVAEMGRIAVASQDDDPGFAAFCIALAGTAADLVTEIRTGHIADRAMSLAGSAP
jgi:hypothetical protein